MKGAGVIALAFAGLVVAGTMLDTYYHLRLCRVCAPLPCLKAGKR